MKNSETLNQNITCEKYRPEQEYTHTQELIDNLPYFLMMILGSIITAQVFDWSFRGIIFGGLYFLYGIVGAFWIIVFVCPYCNFFGTRSCPCGYGQIAVKIRTKSSENQFSGKFKKHIPVIVPLWILPVVIGVIPMISKFNLSLLILLVAFSLNSFVILPLIARKYGCGHCPQKDDCPWMVK